jgi:hypothetical protein
MERGRRTLTFGILQTGAGAKQGVIWGRYVAAGSFRARHFSLPSQKVASVAAEMMMIDEVACYLSLFFSTVPKF